MNKNDGTFIQTKVSCVLPAKKWKVFRMISRAKNFPEFMPNVKNCSVLEKGHNSAITCWNVEVDHVPISWKEKDEFDFTNFKIHFKAIGGDLEEFEGEWRLTDHAEGGTEVTVEAKAKIGIPVLDAIIEPAIRGLLEKNFEMMLQSMEHLVARQRYRSIRDRKLSTLKGFAVIGHPYNYQHLVRYFKFFNSDFKLPSQEFVAKLFELTPSYKAYEMKSFESKTGKKINGYFIMCPIIPDMLMLSPERVIHKVVQACQVAEKLSVGIVVLGGFTSIAGEKYSKQLTDSINVPMTTGNALTVSTTLAGIYKAADLMKIDLNKARVTIIGGTGDIGGSVARHLCEKVHEITITSRSEKNLMDVERILFYYGKAGIRTSRDNNQAVRNADIVLAAASVPNSIIDFNNFKRGAVICDVGYPKNISYRACNRKDIFIFSGGIVKLPSEFNLGFDIGLPATDVLYGCFAEAILLALEERYENFSWGKGNLSRERISYIQEAAVRHGFELAPFFWGNRLITKDDIETIRQNAKVAGNSVD